MKTKGDQMLKFTIKISVLMGTMIALSGCPEERPYDREFKDTTSKSMPQQKALIDTNAEYLYVPSAISNTRTTDATFPGYMGEGKIVKLSFAENTLKVTQVDEEDRFKNNPVNGKPVLEVPISHVDYKCAQDADGKCTNREEENNDIAWGKKRLFRIQADQLAVQEINFLPVEITNLFYPCYSEIGSNFISAKVEDTAINIQIEKLYKSRLECSNVNELSDLTFKVRYHYSLIKLNSATHTDYKSLSYLRSDEQSFGFFDTQTLKLSDDNRQTEEGKNVFVNRWKPGREVVYHLTENFSSEENAKIKEATVKAIANINATLAKAGTGTRITLSDKTVNDLDVGDIRNSTIMLVEDPINYGLLGYGPVAANPRTGEIVQGRTVMYLGVLKQVVKNAYEDLVEERLLSNKARENKLNNTQDENGNLVAIGDTNGRFTLADSLAKYSGIQTRPNAELYEQALENSLKEDVETMGFQSESKLATDNALIAKSTQQLSGSKQISKDNLKKVALRLENNKLKLSLVKKILDNTEDSESLTISERLKRESVKDTIKSLHCYFSAENANISETDEDALDKIIDEVGLKKWDQLTKDEQKKVMDAVLPHVYATTLIHEMGHNLGLRHNFKGSEDKDNFYTQAELAEFGIHKEIPYSSVMEYSYKQTNELPVMGKYDVAALRFGYAEKVELADGNIVDLAEFHSNASAQLKPYGFCTDEHVSVNPGCNRFDEGTSLVEIAQHTIDSYDKNYYRRNFRNGRLSFSLGDDLSYAGRVHGTMMNLREMVERYEDIKMTFGLEDASPIWNQYEFLKDLKDGSKLASTFFQKVLTIPDTSCAIATKAAPTRIIGVLPIRAISSNAISCFDKENIQLPEQFIAVGETGRSFQSRKDPNSSNPYIDQIDVRGIWIDKLLALDMLVGRNTGIESFDEFTGNFLDIADTKASTSKLLTDILLDEVVAKTAILTENGEALVAELPIQMFDKSVGQNGHRIPKHVFREVSRAFGLPNANTEFTVEVAKALKSLLPSREQVFEADSLLNSIQVKSQLPNGANAKDFISAKIGLSTIFVNKASTLAANQIVSRNIVLLLNKLGEEKVKEIAQNLSENKKAPKKATADEKMAYALGIEVLGKFLEGGFKDPVFYELMLVNQI